MQNKQHIADLANILKHAGVSNLVICPGSRNAPLMQVFTNDPAFSCYSIVDERSAAYVALGMIKQSQKPVVVISTSGTAVLNLAPAIAEAFYQRLPLIVVTADRPLELPSQFNNQLIKQENVFGAHVKAFYNSLADGCNSEELDTINAELSAIIGKAVSGLPGPVHINVLMHEPLYEDLALQSDFSPGKLKVEDDPRTAETLSKDDLIEIKQMLESGKKLLIIAGMASYSKEEGRLLDKLCKKYQVAVVAENISNLPSELIIGNQDIILASAETDVQSLKPDLIISFGGQVISKRLAIFVRNLEFCKMYDTARIPSKFFSELVSEQNDPEDNLYLRHWQECKDKVSRRRKEFIEKSPFCNLSVTGQILDTVPEGAIVHLGNSGTIRYSQVFNSRSDLTFHSNRGTSGIDGSFSAAVGSALVSDQMHLLILGDLSFVYDSNAMWNSEIPSNLKIIVLNDKGGGIFRIINGPDRMPFYEKFSVTNHPVSIKNLAAAYHIDYAYASDYKSLRRQLNNLFNNSSGARVLEVDTSKSENSSIFKSFYKSLQDKQ